MKKFLAMLLTVLLLLTVCAAFAEEDAAEPRDIPEGRTVVTYWNLITGPDADVLNSIVDQFNASQEEIWIDCYCWSWDDYYGKLRMAILSGTGPDLALSHVDNLAGLYESGCVVCIEDEFNRLGVEYDFSTNVSPALETAMFDGKYYAVPQDVLAQIMVYNKAVYRELSLLDENDNPTFTSSMEDWNAAAEAVEANFDMYGTGFDCTGYGMTGVAMGMYWQLGGQYDFFGEDGLTECIDAEIMAEAYEKLREFYAYNPTEGGGFDMFINEMAPCTNIGTWSVNYAIEQAEANGIELGITTFPTVLNSESKAHLSWSHSLFLPKNDARTDEVTKAALEFVAWYLDNNELWAQAGHIPADASAYETDFFKALPLREGYMNAPETNQALPSSPAIVLYTSSEFNTPAESFLRGEISAEEAAASFKSGVASVFANYVSGAVE